MSSILDSVEWGTSILSLLNQFKNIDPEKPVIMHIRHTERTRATHSDIEKAVKAGQYLMQSTKLGINAAYELGTRLPSNRKYRLFHTSATRTKETAEGIHSGLRSQGVQSDVVGLFKGLPVDNMEKLMEYRKRDVHSIYGMDTLIGTRQMFINRVSGRYPPWEVEESIRIAQRVASIMFDNYSSIGEDGCDLYVSHDLLIACLLFYWCGVMLDESFVEFLDGFLLQLYDDKMVVITKEHKREAYYPYWWNKLSA